MTMTIATTTAGQTHDVFNAHAAGKKSNGQEETYDQNGDRHEDPCNGFQTTKAEPLEHTGTEYSHHDPPHYTSHISHNHLIECAGNTD
jgi:hypothetical protein